MSDLSLVINLGSSSLKAALVDSTGASLAAVKGVLQLRPDGPIMQKESCLKGLSGLSGDDMRTILEEDACGHNGAIRGLDVFRHRLLQLLGSMAASLGAVDVLALTGGIGEHSKQLKQELATGLSWWGDFLTVVIPADEESMIARLCQRHSETPASAAVG